LQGGVSSAARPLHEAACAAVAAAVGAAHGASALAALRAAAVRGAHALRPPLPHHALLALAALHFSTRICGKKNEIRKESISSRFKAVHQKVSIF